MLQWYIRFPEFFECSESSALFRKNSNAFFNLTEQSVWTIGLLIQAFNKSVESFSVSFARGLFQSHYWLYFLFTQLSVPKSELVYCHTSILRVAWVIIPLTNLQYTRRCSCSLLALGSVVPLVSTVMIDTDALSIVRTWVHECYMNPTIIGFNKFQCKVTVDHSKPIAKNTKGSTFIFWIDSTNDGVSLRQARETDNSIQVCLGEWKASWNATRFK